MCSLYLKKHAQGLCITHQDAFMSIRTRTLSLMHTLKHAHTHICIRIQIPCQVRQIIDIYSFQCVDIYSVFVCICHIQSYCTQPHTNEFHLTCLRRDGHDFVVMEDALCFGEPTAPCGAERAKCPIGSVSSPRNVCANIHSSHLYRTLSATDLHEPVCACER